MDSHVLKTALNNCLLEIAVKAEHLLVKFDKGWFVLFIQIATNVIRVLNVGERHASICLFVTETCGTGSFWNSI